MYNTNYAQRIINKQFETNRDLEGAKIKAETESLAKTEFLANISHELRTPLNAIIGFSEIMIAETYGKVENVQYKDYITDINNSGKHLLSVINDILDFSKAAADKLQVDKIELDLNKLASSSMRFVKPRADEASVKLIEDFPAEHVIIYADPKRLKQALLNLLSNAVKFTPAEGSVTLAIRKNVVEKLVYISVTDTGIGMSDQDIPKALSSFGQIDNKLSRKYEGTGLGLPLTKKLVELMSGKFDLKSSPGKGTTVTIEFEYTESIQV
jgi:two-component system cell cycle sensor histidine kinase PleC